MVYIINHFIFAKLKTRFMEMNEKKQRLNRKIIRNAITYLVVCSFLTFVNYQTTPRYWWVLWVWAGWGIGVALPILFHLTHCEEEEETK